MRKRNKGRILSRPKNQRTALLKSMAASLLLHGKITVTQAKAKELRPVVERYITQARSSSVASRRLLASRLPAAAAKKLADEVAPKRKERPGGYTRITNLGPRQSDGARMAVIELID